VDADRGKAQLRRDIAATEAKLRKLKAQLRGTPTLAAVPDAGPTPGRAVSCQYCEHTTPTEQGMRIHIGKAHKSQAGAA